MADPLGYKACRVFRQPISNAIKYLITRSKIIQNQSVSVIRRSTGIRSHASESHYDHTQSTHLASIASLARFVIIDFSA
jgi:hypothetical protein